MTAASADNVITPRFDIKLLPAQTLRAKVSNVESVSKFYVQFSSAEDCNQAISSYMINNDPEVRKFLKMNVQLIFPKSLQRLFFRQHPIFICFFI